MNKHTNKYWFLTLMITLGFASCKENDTEVQDTEKPVVEYVYINGESLSIDAEAELETDTINEIKIVFKDNEALSQSSINIHFADGEHSHDEDGLDEDDHDEDDHAEDDHAEDDHAEDDHDELHEEHEPFSFGPVINDLNGVENILTLQISVPADVEGGDYHLEILTTDEAANSSSYVYTLEIHEEE